MVVWDLTSSMQEVICSRCEYPARATARKRTVEMAFPTIEEITFNMMTAITMEPADSPKAIVFRVSGSIAARFWNIAQR